MKALCPGCGAEYNVLPEWRGKKVNCSKCGTTFVLPDFRTPFESAAPHSSNDDSWLDDSTDSAKEEFRKAVRNALSDGVISAEEKERLLSLRQELGLPTEVAKAVLNEEKSRTVSGAANLVNTVDSGKVNKFLQLATKASEAGNVRESFDYCCKALEEDPENFHAWFGKARALGALSTISDLRVPEMMTGFKNAVDHAPGQVKDELAKQAATLTAESVQLWATVAIVHVKQFAQVESAWPEFVRNSEIALSGLDFANAVLNDPVIAKQAIEVCKINIEGIAYLAPSGLWSVRRLSPEYESSLRKKVEQYAYFIRRFEPDYRPPVFKKAENCFVITATMGHPNHPAVQTLRRFRDEILSASGVGRHLMYWYRIVGPRAAEVIQHSPCLRCLSRIFIVSPGVALAGAVFRLQRWYQRTKWTWIPDPVINCEVDVDNPRFIEHATQVFVDSNRDD